MSVLIREVRLSDAQNLATLSIQVWLHTYAKVGIRDVFARYVFNEFTADRFQAEIKGRTKQLFVAEVSDHLVGYVQLSTEAICPVRKIAQPEIETLYVQEHFIGRHVGSALLEKALEFCSELGHEQIWLLVNQGNLAAREFYISKQFQKIGAVDFELESERHANDVLVKTI